MTFRDLTRKELPASGVFISSFAVDIVISRR